MSAPTRPTSRMTTRQRAKATAKEPNPASPSRPMPTLPSEIILHVIRHVDVPTACCLARVCRDFTPAVDKIIWRSLILCLPENFGEVRNVPRDRDSFRFSKAPRDKAAQKVLEDKYRREIKEKVKTVMMQGSAQRWRSVREVVMMPRPGAINGMIQSLEMVSDNLEKLEILGTGDAFHRHLRLADYETFDLRMVNSLIHFPSLTSVKILDEPLRFHEFIPLLCNAAPNLHTLYADMKHELSDDARVGERDRRFPSFERPTKIRVLRLDFDGAMRDGANEGFVQVLLDILEHCPSVQEVAINWEGEENERRLIGRKLRVMPDLRSLIWNCDGEGCHTAFEKDLPDGSAGYSRLRTFLVYQHNSPITSVPELPNLEVLLLFCFSPPSTASPYAKPSGPLALLPSLAQQLRHCPRLQRVYTRDYDGIGADPVELADVDELVRTANFAGEISSYIHGDEEVVHARFLDEMYMVSDEPLLADDVASKGKRVRYTAADGTERVKTYAHCWDIYMEVDGSYNTPAHWRDYTDYNGDVVPLSVLRKMREQQGASKEEWKGRGVEVGDAAWQVLLDWKAGMQSE